MSDATVSPAAEEVVKEEEFTGMTPDEAAQALGGAKTGWEGKKLRRYIRSSELIARKIGGRWSITEDDLVKFRSYLAKKAEEAAALESAAESETETGDDDVE